MRRRVRWSALALREIRSPAVRVVDGVASAPVESYVVEVRDGVIFVGTKTLQPA